MLLFIHKLQTLELFQEVEYMRFKDHTKTEVQQL